MRRAHPQSRTLTLTLALTLPGSREGAAPWAHFNPTSPEDKPALHAAAELTSPTVLKALLAQLPAGVSLVSCLDASGRTALHIAAKLSRAEHVAALLDPAESSDKTPRHELVLAKDASGTTAIHEAAAAESTACLDQLLAACTDHPGSADIEDEQGRVALHFAAACGRVEACKALVAAGAKIEHRNRDGAYPAVVAFNAQHDDVVRYLRSVWESKKRVGRSGKSLGRAGSAGFTTIDNMKKEPAALARLR